MATRLPYFDYMKGVLILLVVLGHCIERGYDTGVLHDINTVLYTFRMPLFVMISGYFSKKRENLLSIAKNMLPLFVVYVIFNTLHVFMDGDGKTLLQNLIVPGWTMWFILSLIFWNFIDYFIPDSWSNNARGIIACFALSIIAGLIPLSLEFSFQRTFNFLPFFFIGKFLRRKGKLSFALINKYIAVCIIVLISTIMVLISTTGLRHVIYGADSLYTYSNHLYSAVGMKVLFYLFTLGMSFSIGSLWPKKMPSVVTAIGKQTLFIYMYHSLLILLVLHFYNLHSPLECMLLYAIILVALYALNRLPLFKHLTDTKKIKSLLGV